MNKVILMGRLTKNPEIKYAGKDNDMAVARYTLAVNRRYKRDGEQEADFISCVTFGKSAEFAQKYLRKGMRIVIGVVSAPETIRIRMGKRFIQPMSLWRNMNLHRIRKAILLRRGKKKPEPIRMNL